MPKNMPDCIFTRMSLDATVALLNFHRCDKALTWKQVEKILFLDNATVARAKLIVDKLSLVLHPSVGRAITDEHYQAYLLLGACRTVHPCSYLDLPFPDLQRLRHPLCHVSFTQAINKEAKKPVRVHVASTITEKKFKTTSSHSTPNCESSASATRPPSKAKFRAPVAGELYANCKQCNVTSPFKGFANRDQSIEYKRSCPNCKSEVVVSPAVKPKTLKRERRAQRRSPVLEPECVPVPEQETGGNFEPN